MGNNWLRPSRLITGLIRLVAWICYFYCRFALHTCNTNSASVRQYFPPFYFDSLLLLPVYTMSNRKIMQSTLILTLFLYFVRYMACKMRMGLAVLQTIHTNVTFFSCWCCCYCCRCRWHIGLIPCAKSTCRLFIKHT